MDQAGPARRADADRLLRAALDRALGRSTDDHSTGLDGASHRGGGLERRRVPDRRAAGSLRLLGRGGQRARAATAVDQEAAAVLLEVGLDLGRRPAELA